MLTEQEIRGNLHASRGVPLPVPSPYGPLGLEQLAKAVARATADRAESTGSVQRSLTLLLAKWQ